MMGAQVSAGYSACQSYEKAQGDTENEYQQPPPKKYGVWPGLLRIFRQTVMLGKRVRAMRQVHRAVRQVHP